MSNKDVKRNTLVIIGASGHAKVLADTALLMGYQSIIFLDRRAEEIKQHYGFPVLDDNALNTFDPTTTDYIVAIGDNSVRASIMKKLQVQKFHLINLIHPSSVVSASAKLGVGIFIGALAVVNPEAVIESGAIINTAAVVEHDCVVGFCAHVSPNATLAGGVKIGACSWIGAGASVKQLCKIADGVVVGMGSVVLKDVLEVGQVVVGVPATIIA